MPHDDLPARPAPGRRNFLTHVVGTRLPRVPARLVPRPTLLRRLDRLAPLSVVHSLPGFGKTTLLAEWARTQRADGAGVVWATVSPHGEPTALAHQLDAALAPLDHDAIVVVDDVHHLSDPGAIESVVELVLHHDRLHLVLAADGVEHVSAAAVELGLVPQHIKGVELAVPPTDVPRWAAAWGHDVLDERAAQLTSLVGGWPEALRLVLDETPPGGDTWSTSAAEQFAQHEVLGPLAELLGDAYDTVQRLALPRSLETTTVVALLGEPRGESLASLDEMLHHGVVSSVPGPVARWQFPELLRRCLARSYEQTRPASACADHRVVAAALHEDRSAPLGEVLEHARRGEAWDLLSRLWTRLAWQLVELAPEVFSQAYADLPSEVLTAHPELRLPASLAGALRQVPDDDPLARGAQVLRHYVQEGLDYLPRSQDPNPPSDRTDRLVAAMVGLRQEGRLRESLALAASIDRDISRQRLNHPRGRLSTQTSWFLMQWGHSRLLEGNRVKGAALLQRAFETDPVGVTAAHAAGLLALNHSIVGARADATTWLDRYDAVPVSGWWAASFADMPARLARAALALDVLDADAAEEELSGCSPPTGVGEMWPAYLHVATRHALLFGDPVKMLDRIAHVTQVHQGQLDDPSSVASGVLTRCRADLTLAAGLVDAAARILDADLDPLFSLRAPAARMHLMTGDLPAAHRIASSRSWALETTSRDRSELLMLAAVAALELGGEDRAARAFSQAHALCVASSLHEPYLTPSPEQLQRLLELTGSSLDAATLAATTTCRRVYPVEVAAAVVLTPRERAVLNALRHHPTAASVARAHNLSVNTIRKQIVSLYAKLDVHDRAAALHVADQLGLLEA